MAEGVDDLLGLGMWHAPRPLNTLWCPCGCGYKGDARVPQGALRDAVSLDEFLKKNAAAAAAATPASSGGLSGLAGQHASLRLKK